MYNINVAIDIKKPAHIPVRKFREIMKRNTARIAKAWHQHMMPSHFRQPSAGGGKYGYAPRTAKYVAQKQRAAKREGKADRKFRHGSKAVIEGGRNAIVSSGQTRRMAMLPPEIKGFPTKARLKMRIPSYASMKPRAGKGPNLGKEITRVTPAEARILRKQLAKSVLREFDAARKQNRKTVKV